MSFQNIPENHRLDPARHTEKETNPLPVLMSNARTIIAQFGVFPARFPVNGAYKVIKQKQYLPSY